VRKLPTLPYLAPWYRIARAPGKVVLEYGQRIVCLEGGAADRLVPTLLPLLDGTRTVDEIVRVLGGQVRPAIENAIAELESHGLLIDGPPVDPTEARPVADTARFLAALRPGGSSLAEAAESIRGCSVAVAGEAPAGVEAARLLRAGGVEVEHTDGPAVGADLTICAPSPAELLELRRWNGRALGVAAPWLQVLPFDGRYAAVGPLYLPGDTCCYECFRLRRAANIDAAEELPLLDDVPGRYPSAPVVEAVTGAIAAELALGWLVHGDHYAPAAFYALELVPTISLTVHHVHRVPRCSACSGLADVAAPLPWHKEIASVPGG
jgi:bacteriocin biosynthesis cyclodehydratase domain-containing protein